MSARDETAAGSDRRAKARAVRAERAARAAERRGRRKDAALRLFSSRALFLAGIAAMPAFLFNPSLESRAAQFFYFWALVVAVGKRNSAVLTLAMSAGIVAFNLFVPYGAVLATLGPFPITEGALRSGLEKALTLEGLILLSRATIRSDLRLPGRFGAVIGESFRYFELISEKKGMVDRKDPIGGIDALMVALSDAPLPAAADGPEKIRRPAVGILVLAAAVAGAWAFAFAPGLAAALTRG